MAYSEWVKIQWKYNEPTGHEGFPFDCPNCKHGQLAIPTYIGVADNGNSSYSIYCQYCKKTFFFNVNKEVNHNFMKGGLNGPSRKKI